MLTLTTMMATRQDVANSSKDNNQPCVGDQQWMSKAVAVDDNGGGSSDGGR